jgi:hypothetical protein
VGDYGKLVVELIGHLPLVEQIEAYWTSGQIEKALPLAEKSISEVDIQRSRAVIDVLAGFRSTRIFKLVQRRFNETKNGYLKEKFISSIGTKRAPVIFQLLLTALTDDNNAVRGSAAKALGQLGSHEAVGPLIERLEDRDENVRHDALIALGKIGDIRAYDAVAAVFTDPAKRRREKMAAAATLLAFQRQEGLDFLQQLADSSRANTRKGVAEVLGAFFTESGAQLLLKLLDDEELSVKA